MALRLVAGQNAPLASQLLRFRAENATPFDVSVLVVDEALQSLSSEHFVFYNQPKCAGVHLDSDNIVRLDLDAVDQRAASLLCVVSVDPAAPGSPSALARGGLSATLTDESGQPIVLFDVSLVGSEAAVICMEIYRRGADWKVRAVGQGYDGGLAEAITKHGVQVDQSVPQHSVPPPPSATSAPASVPLDPAHSFERMWMIFEDAARSAASFRSSRGYAQGRLDDEMSSSVADPATRNGPDVARSQALAQQRCDELVAQAQSKFDQESTMLAEEIGSIDPLLPCSLASLESEAWARYGSSGGASDGMRIGELSTPDLGELRVPFCVEYPLSRPLWIVGDSAAAASVVAALALRILVASPTTPTLEVVDLTGALKLLTEPLAELLKLPVVSHVSDVADRLTALSESVDLAEMAVRSGLREGLPGPRLVILNDFPHGYSAGDAARIVHMADRGPAVGISLIVVGEDATLESDAGVAVLSRIAQQIPASGLLVMSDPWTRNEWIVTPDRVPEDPVRRTQLMESIVGQTDRNQRG